MSLISFTAITRVRRVEDQRETGTNACALKTSDKKARMEYEVRIVKVGQQALEIDSRAGWRPAC